MRLKDNQQMALDNQPNPVTPSPEDLKRMFEHPADPAEAQETRNKRNKKIALIATSVVAGVGVLATGGALVANMMRGPSQASPHPVKTPTAETSQSPTPETMPDSLKQFVDMPHEQFWALTPAERAPYCSWINRDIKAVADLWYGVTKDPLDKLPIASASNTAQEKVQINTYYARGAYIAHQNANEILNPQTEKKALSCAYTDMNSPLAQLGITLITSGDLTRGNQAPPDAYAKNNALLPSTVTSFEAPVVKNGITTQEITTDGYNSPITFTTVNAKDYLGAPFILYTTE